MGREVSPVLSHGSKQQPREVHLPFSLQTLSPKLEAIGIRFSTGTQSWFPPQCLLNACLPWCMCFPNPLTVHMQSQQLTEKKVPALGLFRAVEVPRCTGESQHQWPWDKGSSQRKGISIHRWMWEQGAQWMVGFNTVHTLLMNMQMWLVPEAGGA